MRNRHGIGWRIGWRIARRIRRALPGPVRAAVLSAALWLALAMAGGGASAGAAPDRADSGACARATTTAEAALGIPTQLLGAIALAETGRWDAARKASFAWPWTVTAGGKARYLPGKAAAIAEVEALRARGVSNIDVGCMQINLYYHADAFASLAEAFDPAANAAYAGGFLLRLQDRHRSWSRAIATYHSSTRAYALPYLKRVQRLWIAERRRVALAEREARLAEYAARKAARAVLAQATD